MTKFLNKALRKRGLLIGILVLGLFLRSWRMKELFMYSHDQDLSAWVVRDVIDNGHWRLIGQETSIHGVFIGMLYYYALIPFFLLSGMDPAGGLWLSVIVGAGAIASFYWVFKKVFDRRTGFVAALIYSTSCYVVFVDREVVPTTPVMLWSVWYLYAVWLILKGKQRAGLVLSGLLAGLIWHLNLGLVILLPLIVLALVLSKKRIEGKALAWGMMSAGVSCIPIALFEARHNFIQVRAVAGLLTAKRAVESGASMGLDRVVYLVMKNTSSLVGINDFSIPWSYSFYGLLAGLAGLIWIGAIGKKLALITVSWIAIYVVFFSRSLINPSEYYFNGMMVVWILIGSVGISRLWEDKRTRLWATILMGLFLIINLEKFFSREANRSGYVERRAVVSFIKDDAAAHDYPCVAVSYITEPGNDLGYRYLFRIEGMAVNRPSSESPVYTIVFPHSMVDRIDRSFGALGLIYPDYGKYRADEVDRSCAGRNDNLTDPLFGYTN